MLKIFFNVLKNPSLLRPHRKINTIQELLPMKPQIKCLLFDKDDTLVPLHQFQVKNTQTIQAIQTLLQNNILIYIVSNSIKQDSRQRFIYRKEGEERQIQIIKTKNKKPLNGEQIQQFLEGKDLKPNQIMIVGDRLTTDVYLGNSMGWKAIHITPIEPTTREKHGLGVLVMRRLETMIQWLI